MSNQIVKALEHAAQKIGSTLAKDAGKAVKDLYHSAGENLKKVANNVREVEEKHAADLKKLFEGGKNEVPHPHSHGGGGPRHGRGPGEGHGKGRQQVRSPRHAARKEEAKCPGGEPVDMATGRMFIHQIDADLPGSLPLLFVRNFESGYQAGRWMGPRWTCTFDERLEIDAEGVVYLSPDLVSQAYPHPEPGDDPVHASAGARSELALTAKGDYILTDPATGLVREFTLQPGGEEALLTRVRDRHGRHYTLAYDEDGTPHSITHSGGYQLLVTVDNDRITALRLAGGAEGGHDALLLRYGYADGHLSSVYNSSGKPMRFANDSTGRVLSWTDRNNSQYRYTYDQFDRVVDEGGADGTLRFHFTYGDPDPATGVKVHTETNAHGHTTTYHVNEHAQITAITDALGNTIRYERDEYDRLLAETDPLGRTTRYEYDGAGDLISVTRPDGERATATYADQLDQPVEIAVPGGLLWRYGYDEMGRQISVVDPAGTTTQYGYDELGHPASVTDALGNTSTVRCNAAGLPVEFTDPTGAGTLVERDAFGRPTAVTDPLGSVTRMTWTIEGYPATRTNADGSEEAWTYDGEGTLLTHVDELGQLSTFEHTHFETIAARTAPDGSRITFTHDANMQLVAVTNALGQQWTYTYDEAGRITSECDFQGRTIRYWYDPSGQLLQVTNPLGQGIEYTYDLLGRCTAQNADGRLTTFAYDTAGNLIRATNPDADVCFTFDALGMLLSETVNGRTLSHTLDVLGRRTRRTTPAGHVSSWSYDEAGRPTGLATAMGDIDFAYDSIGRESHREIAGQLRLTSTWDSRHRLTRLALSGTSATLQDRHFSYQADGSLGAVDDRFSGRRIFELDQARRVTSVRAADWSETYVYDRMGNLASADWPATGSSEAAVGPRIYTGTELQSAGRVRYEYDAAGRMTMRQVARLSRKPDTWRYTWDAEGHLTQVMTPDGTLWRYLYDPFGRRIAKLRIADDQTGVVERTDFTWDALILAEQTTHAPYLPGPHTLSWDHKGLQPIAQSETITTGAPAELTQAQVDGRFFAIITDLVGTPTELVDPATQSIAWRAVPTLWGQTTWSSDSTTYTPLRFPGQYFDPETRLHYNVNRYYDPETARYTSPDPLGLAPAPNPDTYVHNPHTWTDPLGLSPHVLQNATDYSLAKAALQRIPPKGNKRWNPNHNLTEAGRASQKHTDPVKRSAAHVAKYAPFLNGGDRLRAGVVNPAGKDTLRAVLSDPGAVRTVSPSSAHYGGHVLEIISPTTGLGGRWSLRGGGLQFEGWL
ncbi:RHS repeat-associated core domain-containing protein [Saccharothrix sp. ST-888]|uniref:RHS repeat-associated core domain-containing protein n=1 Tax=Saccharothrix sp. ST-888 TaxID=1427391 RepID=UPI0006976C6C|nr:RHS repeat-associated core domain-containing protein [Saccharothrix sp. ST-888]